MCIRDSDISWAKYWIRQLLEVERCLSNEILALCKSVSKLDKRNQVTKSTQFPPQNARKPFGGQIFDTFWGRNRSLFLSSANYISTREVYSNLLTQHLNLSIGVVGKKYGARSFNFPTDNCKFLTDKIMGARNFNFAPPFYQNGKCLSLIKIWPMKFFLAG